jgi:magnesium transporter
MMEIKFKNITWISLIRPGTKEIRVLSERFPQIHELVLKDISSPTKRPSHVENFENHLYMVLHFPNFLEDSGRTISQEVDFIMLKNVLITVQYEEVPLLRDLRRDLEGNPAFLDRYGRSTAHLLNYILRGFFAFVLKELDELQERIDELEEQVFSGKEKELLEDLAVLKHNLLDFRKALKAQHTTVVALMREAVSIYGEKNRALLIAIVGDYMKVWNLLENHKDTLDTIYDTNRQLLTTKTNEIMRVFTILAFITFIPTSIANIYGMNIENLPFADSPIAFWQVLGMMMLLTLVVYLALRWRKLV